jgi:hypothetical protein
MYSMDGERLLWKGKPAKIARGATGRRLSDSCATDGRTFYFAQRRVDLPTGINLERVRVRVFDENPVNLFGAVLDDGDAVWYLNQHPGLEVVRLPGADFASVAVCADVRTSRRFHVRDRTHVWYRGQLLEGIAADDAVIIAENMATDGEGIWIFGRRDNALRRSDVTVVWSASRRDLIRTDGALLQLEASSASMTVLAEPSPLPTNDQMASSALAAIAGDIFSVLDRYPPLVVPVDAVDWDLVGAQRAPEFRARFDGGVLVVELAEGDPER